jgi:hypothetical protein
MKLLPLLLCSCSFISSALAQSIAIPWSGHGHDPQHTGISRVQSQPMQQIRWQMPVDLARTYNGNALLIHYASPLITRQNTVLVPVKTGSGDFFRVEARNGSDGAFKWMQNSDYSQPPHQWLMPFGIALTPKNRLYFPGGGGTVLFRDSPDAESGAFGRLAFYGLSNYEAAGANFDANVKINTPITADRYGNIFFGFQVLGATSPALQSGIARIGEDGSGSWRSASSVATDGTMVKIAHNCAPALSNDHKKLYFVVTTANPAEGRDYGTGYLVVVDSRTLATLAQVRLKDVGNPGNNALIPESGSSSPTVGPDGDVYYGVLENPLFSHNVRGWLLHYDGSLAETKTPGSFGWDITPSIVPASAVPSYHGSSEYLVMTKYNNYAGYGSGDGRNKVALLDPNAPAPDPLNPAVNAMTEVLTALSPTPDNQGPSFPDARREWCINTAAIDPFRKCAIASAEDGRTYRWDFATNTFTESMTLTDGIGEAYTPSMIGVDGTVYAILNGILFAIGAITP